MTIGYRGIKKNNVSRKKEFNCNGFISVYTRFFTILFKRTSAWKEVIRQRERKLLETSIF